MAPRAEWIKRAVMINAVIAWRLSVPTPLGCETPELKAPQMFEKSEIAVLPDCACDMGFELSWRKTPNNPLRLTMCPWAKRCC